MTRFFKSLPLITPISLATTLPLLLVTLSVNSLSSQTPPLPVAPKKPYIHKEHGVERPDDYHWLKQKDDPQVKAYLEAENAYAESFLSPLTDLQQKLVAEMRARMVDEDMSVPVRRGKYLYFAKYPAGKDYEALYRKPFPDGAEELLLDHNDYARKGETYLYGEAVVSPNDRYIAWKENHDGSDIFTLRIRDLKTGQMLSDEIPGTAFMMPPVWSNDSLVLFYTEPDNTQRSFRLKRHIIGQQTSEDVTLYEEQDGRFDLRLAPTSDRKYLLLNLNSTNSAEVRYLPLDKPTEQPRIFSIRRDGIRYQIAHHGTSWFIVSNDGGTNGVLLSTAENQTEAANWKTVWPYDGKISLESVSAFSTHLTLYARQKGIPGMFILNPASGEKQWITAPVEGASLYMEDTPEYSSTTQRVYFSSFLTPGTIADVSLTDGTFNILKRRTIPSGFDSSKYEVRHLLATASDGVEIPIWMVQPKNRKNGPIPVLLEGYGSYGSCNDPGFSSHYLSLLDRGIAIAYAQPRGGGEFGRAWHDAGKVKHKATTSTDFLACAEHLIKTGITSQTKLIGYGVSAGGLIAGYSINERPDLFRAFIADVPFVDALNTQCDPSIPLVIGEYEEWGNPTDLAEFEALRLYTPYETIKPQSYPALYVTAGWNDPRVMYWEPAKWVAKIRSVNTSQNPILLLTQFASGHGGTTGRYGNLIDVAKQYAFILKVLALDE